MEARIADVINAAATVFCIPREKIMEKRRFRDQVHARQMVHYVAKGFGHSYLQIACRLGGMDHTTVMHGCRKMADLVADREEWAEMAEATRALAKTYKDKPKPDAMVTVQAVIEAERQKPRLIPKPRPLTIQEANDAQMERRAIRNGRNVEDSVRWISKDGVYIVNSTAEGERALLAALRREHPDREIDLLDAKEYGAAVVTRERVA